MYVFGGGGRMVSPETETAVAWIHPRLKHSCKAVCFLWNEMKQNMKPRPSHRPGGPVLCFLKAEEAVVWGEIQEGQLSVCRSSPWRYEGSLCLFSFCLIKMEFRSCATGLQNILTLSERQLQLSIGAFIWRPKDKRSCQALENILIKVWRTFCISHSRANKPKGYLLRPIPDPVDLCTSQREPQHLHHCHLQLFHSAAHHLPHLFLHICWHFSLSITVSSTISTVLDKNVLKIIL